MPGWGSFPEPLEPLARRLALLSAALQLDAEESERWVASFYEARWAVGRVNPLRGVAEPEELGLESFFTPSDALHPLARLAFRVSAKERSRLTRSEAWYKGQLTLQSLSSQAAIWALDPQPGETILDLAAAPGGKTALIAAALRNEGLIDAVERSKSRFFQMRALLDQLGVTAARTHLTDGRRFAAQHAGCYQRVLLDAPCSSEARIVIPDPRTWRYWSLAKVRALAALQKALLWSAWQALAPGGRLLYATCSFAPEENEWVVAELLAAAPDAVLLPLPFTVAASRPGLPLSELHSFAPRRAPRLSSLQQAQLCHSCRILPFEGWSGFFFALFEKAIE